MASGSGQKRITKELKDLIASPPAGTTVELRDESNLHVWKVMMDGPPNTPFQTGKFEIILTLPPTYPFKPPTITFQTKIYHPNVSNDSPPNSGMMCLGMLRDAEWKPSTKMAAVLEFVRNLLIEPDTDDAVEQGIAERYRTERGEWEKEAREWTKRYAGGKK